MWFGVAVLGVLLFFWAILDTRKPEGFPPGPRWWPLFGSVFILRDVLRRAGSQRLAWKTLAGWYGPVCGMRIGFTQHAVLVSGREAVAQVLENQDFDGRPNHFASQFRTMGQKRGVLTTEGKVWMKHRQFLMENMDTVGCVRMDDIITEEVQKNVGKLLAIGEQRNVQGTILHEIFQICVLNILWKWTSGVRFEDDEPSRVKFLQTSKDFLNMPDETEGALSFVPELTYMMPKDSGYSQFSKIHIQIWTKLSELVWEHKQAGSEKSANLIDVYLQEMRDSDKTESTPFSEMQLVALIKDIFGAGSQTTSKTISIAILLMLTNQKVQTKVQKEIDCVTGRTRLVSKSDIPRLPYVNAVLMEASRIATVTSNTVPHRAVRDTKISGYIIPENSIVFLDLWSVHMDEQHWGDPGVFRPERFLDESGRLKLDPWFMPFGLGRRRCAGEKLAWDILFLSFSLCLQQLTFSVPSGSNIQFYFAGTAEFSEFLDNIHINVSSRFS